MTYSSEVLADSPVLYYRLNETSGTTFTNAGSVAGNGTLTASGSTLAQTSLVPADADTCLKLNGAWISGGATATALGIAGNSDRTIECWLQVDTGGAGLFRVPWAVGGGSNPSNLYIGCDPTAPTAWEIGLWGGATTFTLPNPATQARHVVLTYTGSTRQFKVWVDGSVIHSYTHGADLTTTGSSPFDVAFIRAAGSNNWTGWLDEVAVYNSVLSDARILAHYNAGAGIGGGDLTGTIAAATTVSGTLSGSGALSGTSAASSAATGTLRGLVPVTGTIAAATTVSGTLSGSGALSGASAATSSAAATLRGIAPLSGTSAAATTVSGDLTGTGSLSGSSAASSTASGVLSSPADLSGTIAATSGASGTLGGSGALSANSAASSGASGSLSSADTLAGGAAASSTLSGTLTGSGALAGTSAATSGATGSLSSPAGLTGTISILSGATATLGAIASGTGTAAAVSDSSASLSGLARSSGTVAIVSGLTGTIGAIGRLSGTILATSGATATFFGAPPANDRTDADAATGRTAASTVAGRGPRHPRYGW